MIRIIGGTWRGRRIETPPGLDTRPAADAFRARVMNILGPDLSGLRVMDVFAGSGAFGLESLSRGALLAVFVERGRAAALVIRRNIATLAPPDGAARVVAADAYRLPPHAFEGGPFDIVYVAPPYPHFRSERPRLVALLASLAAAPEGPLAPDGVVVLQSAQGDWNAQPVPGLEAYDTRRMGSTDFTFLRRTP